ncbi:SDR family oxidoreductase [Sabulicella rubraurantiaca]|uniref:SDR family oxidoreductase n=1 Tax=Sabulicella rubraurantiaca TaxID=2811429 RepID=UPI001A964748|nr:SDR family oxidoreductase [Sabulicella rubraurantiaca]
MSQPTTIVTGVARGIGRAICERLVADGHRVIGLDMLDDPPPGISVFRQADLSNVEEARAVITELVAAQAEVSGLVNNVGSSKREMVAESDGSSQAWLNRLNIGSAVAALEAVLPGMRARRSGRVVNLVSRAVFGRETRSAYAATKAALASMTRSWARELAADGITVNAVGPGMIDTELFRRNNPPNSPDVLRLTRGVPAQRLGRPEEVAHAVAFLLDPRSGYITGQTLFVCGGLSMGSDVLGPTNGAIGQGASPQHGGRLNEPP